METGEYQVSRLLGRGGMAEVYAGSYSGAAGFERPVCIKRILPHLASDPEFREMFVKEAKLAGTLCHSNLVQVFDCIEGDEGLTLVMELVDGVDLSQLLKCLSDEPLSPMLAVHIMGQVLAGLAYAHEQRIVHRDISPNNILVSRQGEVKITDFGIAKVMLTHATRTGKLKGKLAYMSPEQARIGEVDHRTDLYSAGLVLYEMLAGRRFFDGTSQRHLLRLVIEAQRPKITGMDEELARIIERLLDPDREQRFPSAEAVIAALPGWKGVGPLGARELGRTVRLVKGEESSLPSISRSRSLAAAFEPTELLSEQSPEEAPIQEMAAANPADPSMIPRTVNIAPQSGSPPGAAHDTLEEMTAPPEALALPPQAQGQPWAAKSWRTLVLLVAGLAILGFGLGLGLLLRMLL